MSTRQRIEKMIAQIYGNLRVDLYKGYCLSEGENGWIARPFGRNEIYLGRTLAEAAETIQQDLDYTADQDADPQGKTHVYTSPHAPGWLKEALSALPNSETVSEEQAQTWLDAAKYPPDDLPF